MFRSLVYLYSKSGSSPLFSTAIGKFVEWSYGLCTTVVLLIYSWGMLDITLSSVMYTRYWMALASFPGSPLLRRGKSQYIFQVFPGGLSQAFKVSAFKTTTVFFLGTFITLACFFLHFCIQQYIIGQNRFFVSVSMTLMSLQHTASHEISWPSADFRGWVWHTENILQQFIYLVIYGCCSPRFSYHFSYAYMYLLQSLTLS